MHVYAWRERERVNRECEVKLNPSNLNASQKQEKKQSTLKLQIMIPQEFRTQMHTDYSPQTLYFIQSIYHYLSGRILSTIL